MATARNTEQFEWPDPGEGAVSAAASTANYITAWDSLTGGTFLYSMDVSGSGAASNTNGYYYAAERGLVIRNNSTAFSQKGQEIGLRGLLSGTQYWQLHHNRPGVDGTSFIIPDQARLEVNESDFTFSDN